MQKIFTQTVKSLKKIWHKLMPYRYCIEFFIITIIFCLVIDCIGHNPSKLWSWYRYGYLLIFSILFTIIIERKSYSEAEKWLNLGQEYNPIDELTEILDSTNKEINKISYLKIDKKIKDEFFELFESLIRDLQKIENYYKIYLYHTKLNLETEKYNSEFFQYLSTTFEINIFFNNSLKQLEEELNLLEEKLNLLEEEQENNESRKIEQANKTIKCIRNFIKKFVNEKGAYETRADVVGIWRSKYNKDVFNIFVKHKDEFSNIPSTENYPYIDQYRQNQIENYKKLIRKTIIDNKLELFENVKKLYFPLYCPMNMRKTNLFWRIWMIWRIQNK
ncbi:hypothetical protein [Coleofasciculus sp.]|uniref:hypothetical protein n=1 Tax=Coleofasciculus sp. TaxID=3100458 RepID=UPI003A14C0C7